MPPVAASRFEALDAWRGISALVVSLVHLTTESVLHRNPLVGNGTRFVDFFFVLSGFVIAHAYRDRLLASSSQVWPFLVRRIGRLWPLHVAVLFVLIGLQVSVLLASWMGIDVGQRAAFGRSSVSEIPANLLLVHAWGFYDKPTWNIVSWSISTEMFAYCAFAAMCALLPTRWLSRVAVVILAASALVVVACAPAGMKSMTDFGVFRCLFGFMTGVLVRALWELCPLRLGTLGEVLVTIGVLAAVSMIPAGDLTVLVVPVFALAVWVFASEGGAVSRILRTRLPQALGAWSYSIYMVHPLLTTAVLVSNRHRMVSIDGRSSLDGPVWLIESITVVYLIAVVLVARATYTYIERPGQRLFNRWAARIGDPTQTPARMRQAPKA